MTEKNVKLKLISLPIMYAYPPSKFTKWPPYGLGILTAFLKNKGYDVVVEDLYVRIEENNRKSWFSALWKIDMDVMLKKQKLLDYIIGRRNNKRIKRFAEQISRLISCQGYDVVGISVVNYLQFIFALLLTKKIKSTLCAKVVFGGPFITTYGREVFTEFPFINEVGVDYLIVGDGQVPLLKLIEHLEGKSAISAIPSLIYKHKGKVKVNPKKFFSIEKLSVPDFSDLPLSFYCSSVNGNGGLKLPYQVTRGCTYNCSFCSRTALHSLFETKSYEKVVRELKYMKERHKSNFFFFIDESINCSYQYLDTLCDKFISEKLNIFWMVDIRTDNLDKKLLHKMKKAGCSILLSGIESGSNRILKMMGKGFTSEQASNILKEAYEEGISNWVNLIVGYPHEKKEDIDMTIEFIRRQSKYIHKIYINPFLLRYGTPLFNNAKRFDIENIRPVCGPCLDKRMRSRYFLFDEINGLRWQEKVKQREYFLKRVQRASFKYIVSKRYRITLIPFWLYFRLKRGYFFLGDRSSRLFERLYPYMRRNTGVKE